MNLTSQLDRRVTLQKPAGGRAAYNEPQTQLLTVIADLPAGKSETVSGDNESVKLDSIVRSEVDIEWKVRYFGSDTPRSNWVLIDENGLKYRIVSPAVEIGRRVGWILKTKVIE